MIVGVALIAGVAAIVFSLILPAHDKAQALLLITKLRPNVTLDSRFQTVAEENVVNLSLQDEQLRRQTLVTLAKSPDLMLQVLADLDERAMEERTLAALQGATDVSTQGNLMVLEATAGTAKEAAAMANSWATIYARHVNQLYSGTSPTYEQIQPEVEESLARYETAKASIQEFEMQSSEDELTRQIEQKQEILAGLQQDQLGAARERVSRLLARRDQIDDLLLDIQGLQAQLEGLPAGDLLTAGQKFALFTLEASAFGAELPDLGYTLELSESALQGDEITVQQALGLLGRLAATLQAAYADAQAALETQSSALLEGGDLLVAASDGSADPTAEAAIARLQEEINTLQAELAGERMARQDLDDAMAVAQESYLTLVRKAAETEILSQLTGVEVQLAAVAQPPANPATPGVLISAVVGGLGGAVVGLGLAFLWELWPREDEAPER
ncbi:MAG: hypothetical protein P8129_20235 [Anaerolineae bacterium]